MRLSHGWLALAALGALSACERPAPPDTGAADCAALRDLGKRSLKRWAGMDETAPPVDAPVSAAAAHTEGLAKAAREIGADFAKSAPRRPDLVDTVAGAKMLGELAGAKLEAMSRTLRDLDGRLAPLGKLQVGANDAVEALGKDIAGDVGCGGKAPTAPCAAVMTALAELDHAPAPGSLADGARASLARAATLDALAAAIDGLPAAPPKQKAREEKASRARAAAATFREMGKALEGAAPLEERLQKERQEAGEAALRLASELQAASELCAAPAGSASGAASARPAR